MKAVLVSAFFWYVVLAVLGAIVASVGVAIQFSHGYGVMLFGVLMMLGAAIVGEGMRRG